MPHCKIQFERFTFLKHVPEPSDIVFDKESSHYFIVSDQGILFECDTAGKVIRKAEEQGYDFEGVEVMDSFIYVSDEIPRQVYIYRKSNCTLVRKVDVKCNGPVNKAYESIAYNYAKKCFIMVSEQPSVIVEYDNDFKELARYPFHHARDISGARWYNGALYLLSDEDRCIFKCDPATYQVLMRYDISVLNPEGLAFSAEGNVLITSDNLQRLYFFKNLPTTDK